MSAHLLAPERAVDSRAVPVHAGRMLSPRPSQRAGRSLPARPRPPWHVHWFRHVGEDPLGPAGVYACRCGEVRPGL